MECSRVYNIAQVDTGCHISVSNGVETAIKKPLQITKTVDKEKACTGEMLTYNIFIQNTSLVEETQVVFSDELDENVVYVNESFTVNGQAQTPALDNRTLYYVISTIEPMSSVEIVFQVRIIE